jgi:hypothetical protein
VELVRDDVHQRDLVGEVMCQDGLRDGHADALRGERWWRLAGLGGEEGSGSAEEP